MKQKTRPDPKIASLLDSVIPIALLAHGLSPFLKGTLN
jgi:hypothetical protein